MTGSVERTKWWQNGELVFGGAELDEDSPLPSLPVECVGGDVGENVYTYRDMIPLPLECHQGSGERRGDPGQGRVHRAGDGRRTQIHRAHTFGLAGRGGDADNGAGRPRYRLCRSRSQLAQTSVPIVNRCRYA